MVNHAAYTVARCTPPGADKQSGPTVSVRARIAVADDGDVVDEQDALHEVEFGQAVLVQIVPPEVVHGHHQTAELDLRAAVLLCAVAFLEFEEVVADVLPLALLHLDGDADVSVVEVNAVVEPKMRPELAVRVEATGSSSLVLVLREAVGDRGIEPADLRVFRRTVEDVSGDSLDGRPYRRQWLVRERLGRRLGAPLAQFGDLLDDDLSADWITHEKSSPYRAEMKSKEVRAEYQYPLVTAESDVKEALVF